MTLPKMFWSLTLVIRTQIELPLVLALMSITSRALMGITSCVVMSITKSSNEPLVDSTNEALVVFTNGPLVHLLMRH